MTSGSPVPAPRPAARAFVFATAATLVVDGILAAFTALIALTGSSGSWWMQAHLVERGRWVVVALLLLPLASWLEARDATASQSTARDATASQAGAGDHRSAAWRLVGAAAMTVPLLWIVATWVVQATLFTIAGRWDIDGRMFLTPDYYRRLFMGYVPWLVGGLLTRMASRHV